jgi:hypothetical protein
MVGFVPRVRISSSWAFLFGVEFSIVARLHELGLSAPGLACPLCGVIIIDYFDLVRYVRDIIYVKF